MACELVQPRILEYLEEQLPVSDRTTIEAHLTTCPDCRALVAQLKELDGVLSCSLQPPALSHDFSVRLLDRINHEASSFSDTAREQKKAQWQAEFEEGLAKLGGAPFRTSTLLNLLGWASLACFLPLLTKPFAPGLMNSLVAQDPASQSRNLAVSAAISAVFLGVGLACAFPRPFRRLLAHLSY